ncbi:MAG: PQQ-dependent sugar dehydrogenase, partial [Nitrosopumilaceae archaeon]
MDKKIRIMGIIAAIAASILIVNLPSNPIVIPEPTTNATKTKSVEVIATNLQKPWAMDFSDTRIFFTEKVGRIRVIDSDIVLEEPLANLRVADVIDGGLLGLALHPDFANNHYLYVFYTYAEDSKLWNKVIRITEAGNKLAD